MGELVPFRQSALMIPVASVSTFHYLINHRLCSKFNMNMLRERIRELYTDAYTLMGVEFEFPSLQEIATEIDYENILTLQIFYAEYGYAEEDIDNIISEYTHHVGAHLDVTIEEVLQSLAFPYRGSAFGTILSFAPFLPDESQYILFPEFL